MNNPCYALVGKDNRVWGFYDTTKEINEALNCQPDPDWYTVERVNPNDYINEDGRLITQKFRKELV